MLRPNTTPKARIALSGAAICLLAACGGEPSAASATYDATDRDFFGSSSLPKIPLEDSPSRGAEFDFCTDAPTGELDLNQAAWLTFFAANEYAHFGYLGPMLNKLGFGHPDPAVGSEDGGLDMLWKDCAIDLYLLREHDAANADKLTELAEEGTVALQKYVLKLVESDGLGALGPCADMWFTESYYAGTDFPAAAMEKWLIRSEHPGNYIQFFSGGEMNAEGTFFKERSTQVQYTRHGELPVAVISFRGTEVDFDDWEKIRDVFTDALAFQVVPDPAVWGEDWGEVHKGFLEGFESVRTYLDSVTADLEGSGVDIYVTGHSLGGALSTLMTAHLLNQMESGADVRLRAMYNIGSPRVGDTEFKTKFDALVAKHGVTTMRIRNQDDLVTRVPFIQDWQHVDQLVYIDENELAMPSSEPKYHGVFGTGLGGSAADHDAAKGYYSRIYKHMIDPRYADYLH